MGCWSGTRDWIVRCPALPKELTSACKRKRIDDNTVINRLIHDNYEQCAIGEEDLTPEHDYDPSFSLMENGDDFLIVNGTYELGWIGTRGPRVTDIVIVEELSPEKGHWQHVSHLDQLHYVANNQKEEIIIGAVQLYSLD